MRQRQSRSSMVPSSTVAPLTSTKPRKGLAVQAGHALAGRALVGRALVGRALAAREGSVDRHFRTPPSEVEEVFEARGPSRALTVRRTTQPSKKDSTIGITRTNTRMGAAAAVDGTRGGSRRKPGREAAEVSELVNEVSDVTLTRSTARRTPVDG